MDSIKVTVKTVIYFNETNGFSILKGKINNKTPCTVKGFCVDLEPESIIECEGNWINDKKYGEQFDAKKIELSKITNIEQIYIYLESGAIKGIGPSTAKKIITKFKEKTFEILDENPEKLKELHGIGNKKINTIIESWKEKRGSQKIINEILKFNVNYKTAIEIYNEFKESSLTVINESPYDLLTVSSVNFLIADKIALEKGIEKNDPLRIMEGVNYILKQRTIKSGDTAFLKESILLDSKNLLRIQIEEIDYVLTEAAKSKVFYEYEIDNKYFIQSEINATIEESISQRIKLIKSNKNIIKIDNIEDKIEEFFNTHEMDKVSEQIETINNVLSEKIAIITGGPGVGKTSILNAILYVLKQKVDKNQIILCAPTGKAAKRMSESTSMNAETIHRLLKYNPAEKEFSINELNQLEGMFLVIDESSMVDAWLLEKLLKATPLKIQVLLIGDSDQLASVGEGAILRDLILSKIIPEYRLDKIQRQAKNSKIITTAHRVNNGDFFEPRKNENDDFFYIKTHSDEKTLETIISLISHKIPSVFKKRGADEIQCLTPMHKGILGTKNLNIELQKIFNKNCLKNSFNIEKGDTKFFIGDKVIQTKNNYDKMVFNGDIGYIVDLNQKTMICQFENEEIEYEKNEIDELSLFYAGTIHKSQGSEFKVVVMPITNQYSPILDRSLLYTGITRGKELVIVVGNPINIEKAIENKKSRERITLLKEKLMGTI